MFAEDELSLFDLDLELCFSPFFESWDKNPAVRDSCHVVLASFFVSLLKISVGTLFVPAFLYCLFVVWLQGPPLMWQAVFRQTVFFFGSQT